MKMFSVPFNRSGSSRKRSGGRDDRPFPSTLGGEDNSGTYIISSPPRYEHVRYPVTTDLPGSHGGPGGTLPRLQQRSVPEMLNHSGFTIYDDHSPAGILKPHNGDSRKRAGSLSNPSSPKMFLKNPFQRSRSSSGRQRLSKGANLVANNMNNNNSSKALPNGMVWPTSIAPMISSRGTSEEPIYSEPLPPVASQIKEAERTMLKFYPDPNDPVQISNHIYEYLVTRRTDASTQSLVAPTAPRQQTGPIPQPRSLHSTENRNGRTSQRLPVGQVGPDRRRRGSLTSSSPSSSGSTSHGGTSSASSKKNEEKMSNSVESSGKKRQIKMTSSRGKLTSEKRSHLSYK